MRARNYGIQEFEFEEDVQAPAEPVKTSVSEACNPEGKAGRTKLNAFMIDNSNAIHSHRREGVGSYRGDTSGKPKGEIYAKKYASVGGGLSMSFLDDALFAEDVRSNMVETGTIVTSTGDVTTTYENPLPPPNRNHREYSRRDNRLFEQMQGQSKLDMLQRTEVEQPLQHNSGKSSTTAFQHQYEGIRDQAKVREMRDVFFNRSGVQLDNTNQQSRDPFGNVGEHNFVRINPHMPATQSFAFENEGGYNRNTQFEKGSYQFDKKMFEEMKSKKSKLNIRRAPADQTLEAQRTVPIQDVLKTLREQKSTSSDRNVQAYVPGSRTGNWEVDHSSERIFKSAGPLNVQPSVPSSALTKVDVDDIVKMINKDKFEKSRTVPTDNIVGARAGSHDELTVKAKQYKFSRNPTKVTDGFTGDAHRTFEDSRNETYNADNINDQESGHIAGASYETFPSRDAELSNRDVTAQVRIPSAVMDDENVKVGQNMRITRTEQEMGILTKPQITIK